MDDLRDKVLRVVRDGLDGCADDLPEAAKGRVAVYVELLDALLGAPAPGGPT